MLYEEIKIISLIVILYVFCAICMFKIYAYDDVTPPVVHSASINKSTVKCGDEVELPMNIEDDFSGVAYFGIQWQKENDTTKSFMGQFKYSDSGVYKYTIPNNTEAGNYQAIYVNLGDGANNNIQYYRDNYYIYNKSTNSLESHDFDNEIISFLSNLDLEIEDSNQDTVAPVVSNVKRVTKNFKSGDRVTIEFEVTDDNSGVKNHSGGITYARNKEQI